MRKQSARGSLGSLWNHKFTVYCSRCSRRSVFGCSSDPVKLLDTDRTHTISDQIMRGEGMLLIIIELRGGFTQQKRQVFTSGDGGGDQKLSKNTRDKPIWCFLFFWGGFQIISAQGCR